MSRSEPSRTSPEILAHWAEQLPIARVMELAGIADVKQAQRLRVQLLNFVEKNGRTSHWENDVALWREFRRTTREPVARRRARKSRRLKSAA